MSVLTKSKLTSMVGPKLKTSPEKSRFFALYWPFNNWFWWCGHLQHWYCLYWGDNPRYAFALLSGDFLRHWKHRWRSWIFNNGSIFKHKCSILHGRWLRAEQMDHAEQHVLDWRLVADLCYLWLNMRSPLCARIFILVQILRSEL